MLIAKIFINEKQIDEIHIQNVGLIKNSLYRYKILKPEVPDKDITLLHNRMNGYRPLLKIALNYLLEIT